MDPHGLSGPFGERAPDGPFFYPSVCVFGPIWAVTDLSMSIPGPLGCQKKKKVDLTAPISPFPGECFQVAFESNPRPRGPYMGLIIIPERPGAPAAGLGCRWCVLLDK